MAAIPEAERVIASVAHELAEVAEARAGGVVGHILPAAGGPALERVADRVPGVGEALGVDVPARPVRPQVAGLAQLPVVPAGQYRGAGWGAGWRGAVGVRESDALLGDPVESGGLDHGVARVAGVQPGLVVGDDEQDVWSIGWHGAYLPRPDVRARGYSPPGGRSPRAGRSGADSGFLWFSRRSRQGLHRTYRMSGGLTPMSS